MWMELRQQQQQHAGTCQMKISVTQPAGGWVAAAAAAAAAAPLAVQKRWGCRPLNAVLVKSWHIGDHLGLSLEVTLCIETSRCVPLSRNS